MGAVQLFVGTRKGAYVLETGPSRSAWTVRDPTLEGWEVSDVAVDPRDHDRVLAAVGHFVYGPTVHRSDDGGATWEQVAKSPAYPDGSAHDLNQIWTVVPGGAAGSAVRYAGVDEAGLFVSRDAGDTWTELPGLREHPTRDRWQGGKGGLCCHSVLAHPEDPDRLWVGVSAVGVFRSDDGGETWALKNDGLPIAIPDEDDGAEAVGSCVHRLVLAPDDPDRLYQQNHLGVFRSTDAGDSWERIDGDLPSTFGFPLVVHPRDGDTLYAFPLESGEFRAATDGEPAVYRSRDAGESWDRCDAGLPTDSWVTVLRGAMATDPLDPAGVYVGTTGGSIYASADEGETWREFDCELPRILSLSAAVVE